VHHQKVWGRNEGPRKGPVRAAPRARSANRVELPFPQEGCRRPAPADHTAGDPRGNPTDSQDRDRLGSEDGLRPRGAGTFLAGPRLPLASTQPFRQVQYCPPKGLRPERSAADSKIWADDGAIGSSSAAGAERLCGSAGIVTMATATARRSAVHWGGRGRCATQGETTRRKREERRSTDIGRTATGAV